MLNLLWVLWQKSDADLKLEEDKISEEVEASKDLEKFAIKDESEDLEKVEKKAATKDEKETAATALMG